MTATGDPGLAVLRGAGGPALAAVAVVVAAAMPFGWAAPASALAGGGMGLLALAVGPSLHRLCRDVDPAVSLGIAVLTYCLVIVGLGFAYSALNATTWLSGGWAGLGLLAAILAWTLAQMRAVSKLRQLLYGDDATMTPPR